MSCPFHVSCSTSCFRRNMSTHKDNWLLMHAVFKTWLQKKQHVLQCLFGEPQEIVLHNVFVHALQLSFCWLAERLISFRLEDFRYRYKFSPVWWKRVFTVWRMHLSWMTIRVRLALFTGKSHYIIAVYCQIFIHALHYTLRRDVLKELFMYQHNGWEIVWSIIS